MTCIERNVGSEVEVHYMLAGTSDKGVLTAVDSQWIEITRNPGKRNEDLLLVPLTAVRLVKPLTRPAEPANTLVRPVGLVEGAKTEEDVIDDAV